MTRKIPVAKQVAGLIVTSLSLNRQTPSGVFKVVVSCLTFPVPVPAILLSVGGSGRPCSAISRCGASVWFQSQISQQQYFSTYLLALMPGFSSSSAAKTFSTSVKVICDSTVFTFESRISTSFTTAYLFILSTVDKVAMHVALIQI